VYDLDLPLAVTAAELHSGDPYSVRPPRALDRSYHSAMDPAIAGALIGGGFALVGVGASIWATNRTLRANRELAREERLWEKRSALYEQLLTVIPATAARDQLTEIFSGLLRLGPAVRAYASDAVAEQWRLTAFTLAPTGEPQARDIDPFVVARDNLGALVQLVREDLQGTRRRIS